MPQATLDFRYPIGAYEPKPFSIEKKVEWLADIKFLPLQLENAILNLDEEQLQCCYREGGWTIHQLVHHVADSHINAYCRFKLALTEDNPTIKPYEEKAWAELNDVQKLPINISHTVGPVWHGGSNDEPKQLASCYSNSLALAVENNIKTISFPNISTGIYAFPKKQAAEIAVQTVKDFLTANSSITRVCFVCFDEENYGLYKKLLID